MPARKSVLLSIPLLIGALMALWALSSCSSPSPTASAAPAAAAPAGATPPAGAAPGVVSYNVIGNDLTEADARAASYCRRYGVPSHLMLLQDGVATYTCSSSTAAVPSPPAQLRQAPAQSPTQSPATDSAR
jgi:hypothetical protein